MPYRNIFSKKEQKKISFHRALLEQMFSVRKPEVIPSYIVDFPHDCEEDKDIKRYLDKQISFFKESIKIDIPCVPMLRPFFYGLHGHSIFFNTDVVNVGDSYWSKPLGEISIDSIAVSDLSNHPFTKNLISQIEYLQENTNYEIPVATPVIMSPVVVFTNLFESNVAFPSMLLFPEKVKKLLSEITRVIIELDNLLDSVIKTERGINTRHILNWVPPYYCTLYGCTLKLISKKIYKQLFLPFDLMILDNYHSGGIHLCGKTDHLVEVFRKMNRLSFIQLNDEASDYFETFYNNLREDQIFFVWPSKKMPVEKILEISGGLEGGNRVVYGGVNLGALNR